VPDQGEGGGEHRAPVAGIETRGPLRHGLRQAHPLVVGEPVGRDPGARAVQQVADELGVGDEQVGERHQRVVPGGGHPKHTSALRSVIEVLRDVWFPAPSVATTDTLIVPWPPGATLPYP
jgi:hypothetical protein